MEIRVIESMGYWEAVSDLLTYRNLTLPPVLFYIERIPLVWYNSMCLRVCRCREERWDIV